jgi:hypothetical protein
MTTVTHHGARCCPSKRLANQASAALREVSAIGTCAHTALAGFKPVALSFLKCYTPFRCIYKAVGHIYGVFDQAAWPGWPPGNSADTALAGFKPVALSFLKCYTPFPCIYKAVGHIYGVFDQAAWPGCPPGLVGHLAWLATWPGWPWATWQ